MNIRNLAPRSIPREQVHALLDRILDVAEGRSVGATLVTLEHSQKDGERPIGAGRPKYIRTWHRAFDAGDPGARREGRSLIMSAECWRRWCTTPTRVKLKPAPTEQACSSIDALMKRAGVRRVS
jgi:hypothetical protein